MSYRSNCEIPLIRCVTNVKGIVVTTVSGWPKLLPVVCLGALLFSACSREEGTKTASQIVARVNDGEISIHQLNLVLGRMGHVPPEIMEETSKRVLEQAIDQELIVQRAMEKKLDRDPQVLQAIEAARREVLSRAYLERIASAANRPTAEQIKSFFDANPALFRERRIYTVRELFIARHPELVKELKDELEKGKSLNDLATFLKSKQIRFSASAAVKFAEQVPMELLPEYQRLRDGQTAVMVHDSGALVVHLASSEQQPVDEKAAAPLIEAFLLNRQRAELMKAALRQERSVARIDYQGDFAKLISENAQLVPQPSVPVAAAGKSEEPGRSDERLEAAPHIQKGLSGLN